MEDIRQIAEYIRDNFHPERIILFGSYAYGTPTASSDIDLFVIMKTALDFPLQAGLIRQELTDSMPIDIIVRSPESLEQRLKMGDFFMQTVMKKGIDL